MSPSSPQINEDLAHQHKVWRLERFAWLLMGLIIIAALLGFAGHGHFSAREAFVDGGLVVEYQRYERYAAQTALTLRLTDVTQSETSIRLGHNFLEGVEVVGIQPEPARVELDEGFTTYVFNTNAPGPIVLQYKPVKPGSMLLDIAVETNPVRTLPIFVYP